MIRMPGHKIHLWPAADRLAWLAANTPSDDPWDSDGIALKLRPKTRANYARIYGIWLAWLDSTDQLLLDETPGQRVTQERVFAWVRHMRGLPRKNGTIKLYLMSLHAMIGIIAPGTDTRFILYPGGRSLHELFPTQGKAFAPHDTRDLLAHAERLHASGLAAPNGLGRSKALRDAAIMAVFYSRGPRVSDMASMRIGVEFRPTGEGHALVRFPAETTKGKRTLEYPLDPAVARMVEDYLHLARPQLRGAAETDRLWMGTTGRPLDNLGLTGITRRRNRDFLGVAEGPHMARKWLTDTARNRSPEAALDCAEVLGHTPQTALKNYAQAVDVHAGLRHGRNVARLRRQSAGLAERAFAAREAGRNAG